MTQYIVSPDAACATVDDGAVVLNLRTRRYYSLNETAALIWQMLEAEAPLDDVVHELTSQFEIDDDDAAQAVADLVEDLAAEALITPVAE